MHCYQFARPNDKLRFVKGAFLRTNREMQARQMQLPPWFWLAANMWNNFAWPMRSLGSLWIPFQCQRGREFKLAHCVLLYSWGFYFKMEDQLFLSQNSDLNNVTMALCIEIMIIKWLLSAYSFARAQMMLLGPQINYMPPKSHVTVPLFFNKCAQSCASPQSFSAIQLSYLSFMKRNDEVSSLLRRSIRRKIWEDNFKFCSVWF